MNKTSFGQHFVEFTIKLEPLLDQVVVNLQQKKDDQLKLDGQIKHRDESLAAIEDSKSKILNYKLQIPEDKKNLKEYDLTILKYQEKIKELKSKKKSIF